MPSITRVSGQREGFEAALDAKLRTFEVDLIACAGFMRLMTPGFVERWRDRMLNIHPSLLPAFKGLDTHARVLAAGVKLTGCTVHIVRPEVDSGPIIAQAAVPVLDEDTAESLAARVLEAEHMLYPHALRFLPRARDCFGERAIVTQAPINQEKHLFWPSLTDPISVASDLRPSAKMKRKRLVAWTLASSGWYLIVSALGERGLGARARPSTGLPLGASLHPVGWTRHRSAFERLLAGRRHHDRDRKAAQARG